MANLSLLGFFGLVVSVSGALALPLFAGCGSVATPGAGGGGNHAGGSHAGGHHAGGSNMGGMGGAAPDCAALAKDESATPVPVRLVNETAADLYVEINAIGCGAPPFLIKDPDGNDLYWTNDGICTQTCADFDCVCTVTCGGGPATRIAPKGSATIVWKGVVREPRTLPASCIEPSSFCVAGEPCYAEVVPKSFPLSFVGTAWTEVTCPGGACTCTPDANGSCVIAQSAPGGDAVQATASYAAGGTSVDLVFKGP